MEALDATLITILRKLPGAGVLMFRDQLDFGVLVLLQEAGYPVLKVSSLIGFRLERDDWPALVVVPVRIAALRDADDVEIATQVTRIQDQLYWHELAATGADNRDHVPGKVIRFLFFFCQFLMPPHI